MPDSLSQPLPDGDLLFYSWFSAMHTRIDLLFRSPDEETAETVATALRQEIRRIELMINKFDPSSELSFLNEQRSAPLSGELFGLISDALAWNRKTNGYFDITAAPGGKGILHVHLEEKNTVVTIDDDHTALDFCGYAKGYALDKCVEIVRNSPLEHALLNFGNSSVAALGSHPCGNGWKVGKDTPWTGHPPGEIVLTDGLFLTTSGNHPRQHHHIINPHTGRQVETPSTVSVLSPSGVSGEVLSTALFAAPPEERLFLSRLPECLYIV